MIPYDYARDLQRGRPVTVQFLLNAMNANTAAIAQGYAEGVLASLQQRARRPGNPCELPADRRPDAEPSRPGAAQSHLSVQSRAWSHRGSSSPGVFGLLLILNGSIVASAAMVKERERGTIEQLLMSPASTTEIIIAKIAPLFILLCFMVVFAIGVMQVVFGVPFHGGLLLILGGAALCILCGISIGTVIATFSKSAEQAQLTSFFVNPPLSTLSGAFYPIEGMPRMLPAPHDI